MSLALLNEDNAAPVIITRVPEGEAAREHVLRDLLFDHPETLPIHELEPGIGRIVSVAKEVHLPGVGYIDLLLVSEHGRLIVVECKLWRSPQARREVVGQILDYARALSRYGYEDLQRVIASRLGRPGNALFDLIARAGGEISEATLVDRVSRDLAAGRLLLLVVGDGITEGTRRIGEYLAAQAGLAFDFGLVEVAEYRFADPATGTERRIVQPRLLARTTLIERHVIRSDLPGVVVAAADEAGLASGPARGAGGATSEGYARWRAFVDRFVADLRFDDPAQPPPRLGGINWMRVPLPGSTPLTLWRSSQAGEIGAFLRFRDADAQMVYQALAQEQDAIDHEFVDGGLPPSTWTAQEQESMISLVLPSPMPWDDPAEDQQRLWFAQVANQFVNIFRPRLLQLTGSDA